ncbi:MAG TPA: nucleotidyltransferase domain-containing protein [Pseudolabrys sp.]|jgi:predicted nucleotidyltransferase
MLTKNIRRATKTPNRKGAKPQMASRVVYGAEVQGWFEDALGRDDPKPSRDTCERLAREFRIVINQQNNAEIERYGLKVRKKDVSLAEEIDKRVGKIRAAANQTLIAASELEDFVGGYQWTDKFGTVSLADIQHVLTRVAFSPIGAHGMVQIQTPAPARGQPRKVWHAAAREIARLIQAAMRDVGYCGRLKMTDEESVPAIVGAAAINCAYGENIKAAGFADAMKQRGRKILKTFDERFPQNKRIKIMTPKQLDILNQIAAWAERYPCIEAMHVFGSIARDDATAASDIDIAFVYSASAMTECYTKVNADWDNLAASLKDKFAHQPKATGLFFMDGYDHKAWAAIRAGREVGRVGKVSLTWTAPKPLCA